MGFSPHVEPRTAPWRQGSRFGRPPSVANEAAIAWRYGLDSTGSAGIAIHPVLMRIVCSIDDSPEARNAARMAGHLADRMRAELIFVHSDTGETSPRADARSDQPCGLLIVGFKAPARVSSALLGDRYRRLVHGAACPVMSVPAAGHLRAGTNVVLGYDLPTLSSAEAAVAGSLAGALDSSLVVAHVEVRSGPRRRTRGRPHEEARRISHEAVIAAGKRLDVRHVERRGRASEHLDAVATDHDGAVIVVGSHRTGWRRLHNRSVATQLQRHERHPVIVVPRRAALAWG
jgi:nucleotide-binding universal stress UspA family protein